MNPDPTISTIFALLCDHTNKPIIVFTQKRTYRGVLKLVDGAGNLILDAEGVKVFVKKSGIISFEV
jgi:small nuclear ribonucleoprotein (snRNP)-like protein